MFRKNIVYNDLPGDFFTLNYLFILLENIKPKLLLPGTIVA